ncbi:hypothetical protein M4914_16990 [Streptomyces somaliensis DSM 40738]|uniref:Uncharacterized protein n=1 Tax=Streptomyces somaliensis (strain ATCC 33201 / DSM 40738 / JCM 12659 / KCTC 9044 / NCTC 11332 / NRRL B-12077 / IP 733) TaxID=1134445 RepID=A0AA44D9A5_STRE0|nr:hypothetical protein [Streptomyces somaliensis]MCQ0024483.1 hypothetical protein [Streptomyces somaliensis DSM 40738]NKY12647.1 hypothetical protein [Streptomyces somaliensis DSM 40738]
MGWTYDHVDATRDHRSAAVPPPERSGGPRDPQLEARLGIPRILRRRVRWVSARLRHQRD